MFDKIFKDERNVFLKSAEYYRWLNKGVKIIASCETTEHIVVAWKYIFQIQKHLKSMNIHYSAIFEDMQDVLVLKDKAIFSDIEYQLDKQFENKKQRKEKWMRRKILKRRFKGVC